MTSSDHRPPAIFLMGPTASGKTALAFELAARFALRIVSVDSALVYRGLDIGSAKPDAATLARFPHELVDIRDPEQAYSAAEFRADAVQSMARIGSGGRVPLLVGGTGLYFRALERGLSALPDADPQLRARLEQQAREHGWPALHVRLAERDPQAAARIHPNDPQRIQRALEVIELSGKTLSAQLGAVRERLPYRLLKLALLPVERGNLHARIEERFDAMLEAGLLDEVRRLRERPGLTASHPSMRAVGYRQAWQHLGGEIDLQQLRDRGVYATRQLAKRQITWLRAEHDAIALDPDREDAASRAARLVQEFI